MTYANTTEISDKFKVFIFVQNDNIIKDLEMCQNFADFFSFEVVGIATEIITLFNTDIEYDGVILTYNCQKFLGEKIYKATKKELLKRDKILIKSVRSLY